ncbi:MAG: heme exporter protein CcmD [Rubrivivax sp.]|nr:heme exporter protein CcmD [Rubrivivax sp.]
MHWSSLTDFLAMGGHGLFVWGSFGVTAAVLAWELISLAQRRRRALAAVRQWRVLQGDEHDAAR